MVISIESMTASGVPSAASASTTTPLIRGTASKKFALIFAAKRSPAIAALMWNAPPAACTPAIAGGGSSPRPSMAKARSTAAMQSSRSSSEATSARLRKRTSLIADHPFLVHLARQLADEARRLHQHVHCGAVAGHHREDEVELLLRARHGDVEEPPLLLLAGDDELARAVVVDDWGVLDGALEQRQGLVHARRRHAHDPARHAQRALRREAAVGEPDDEDGAPLQPLGLVHRRQHDLPVLGADDGDVLAGQ